MFRLALVTGEPITKRASSACFLGQKEANPRPCVEISRSLKRRNILPRRKWYHVEFILAEPVLRQATMQILNKHLENEEMAFFFL